MIPTFKVSIIGKSTVGKTSIVKRLRYGNFNDRTETTIGASFASFVYEGYKYDLWDTAGQERFNSLLPMYFKNSRIILFAFDVTDLETFNSLLYYYKSIASCNLENYRIIIIGNKTDLVSEDDLDYIKSKVKVMVTNFNVTNLIYDTIYVSAKENTNITLLKDSMKNCSQLLNMNSDDVFGKVNAIKINELNNKIDNAQCPC